MKTKSLFFSLALLLTGCYSGESHLSETEESTTEKETVTKTTIEGNYHLKDDTFEFDLMLRNMASDFNDFKTGFYPHVKVTNLTSEEKEFKIGNPSLLNESTNKKYSPTNNAYSSFTLQANETSDFTLTFKSLDKMISEDKYVLTFGENDIYKIKLYGNDDEEKVNLSLFIDDKKFEVAKVVKDTLITEDLLYHELPDTRYVATRFYYDSSFTKIVSDLDRATEDKDIYIYLDPSYSFSTRSFTYFKSDDSIKIRLIYYVPSSRRIIFPSSIDNIEDININDNVLGYNSLSYYQIESVYLPKNIKVSSKAFKSETFIKDVYFEGSKEEWKTNYTGVGLETLGIKVTYDYKMTDK